MNPYHDSNHFTTSPCQMPYKTQLLNPTNSFLLLLLDQLSILLTFQMVVSIQFLLYLSHLSMNQFNHNMVLSSPQVLSQMFSIHFAHLSCLNKLSLMLTKSSYQMNNFLHIYSETYLNIYLLMEMKYCFKSNLLDQLIHFAMLFYLLKQVKISNDI